MRFDVALKLASAAQTTEVGGESGPMINTENATIGDSKSFQQITSLPVNYRGATTSPLAMLATVPGAQQDANGNVSVGGGLKAASSSFMPARRGVTSTITTSSAS